MRNALCLGVSGLLATTYALPEISISKRDRHTNGATDHYKRSVQGHLQKRAGTVSTNVYDVLSWSLGGAYYANVTVGTPAQPQVVILDTGSSDLYFDASSAQTCKQPSSDPESCQGGTYDLSKSSTYKQVDAAPAFNTSFGDGSSAQGPYGSDVVGIGDVLVSPVQFGVAQEVDSTTGYSIGLMGIGYSTNEAVQAVQDFYPNMPEVLKDSGVINSRLYSIYLNDARSTSGSILFGGIDKSKYTGELATVDLLPPVYNGRTTGVVNQFITSVTGVNTTVGGKQSSIWSGGVGNVQAYQDTNSLPVLLDTGSTAWSLPTRYYEAIVSQFTYIDPRRGICSCSHVNSGDSISLEFAGKVTIQADVSSFIVPIVNSTTREPVPLGDGTDACAFLLAPAAEDGMGFQTLGDAILRSMYVVFDLDNGQVSIAQANINSTASPDIVTVQAGPTGVAAAVSNVASAPSNTWSVAAAIATTPAYSVTTAKDPIGTATGEAAVPESAQLEGDDDSGNGDSSSGGGSNSGGSGTGSGSHHTSSGAAAGLVVPGAGDNVLFYITGLWVAGMALGAGLML